MSVLFSAQHIGYDFGKEMQISLTIYNILIIQANIKSSHYATTQLLKIVIFIL